jgi:hypothetical protein
MLMVGSLVAQPLSNQEVIFHEIASKISSEGDRFINQGSHALVLDKATVDALQALQSSLIATGMNLTSNFENSSQLKVQVNSENRLTRINRNYYERSIQGTVGLTISESNGLIKDSITFRISETDTIHISNRFILESDWEPSHFSEIGSRRFYSRIQKFVEPVLITSAVATTVYLLYNIRSQ